MVYTDNRIYMECFGGLHCMECFDDYGTTTAPSVILLLGLVNIWLSRLQCEIF